MSGNSILGAGHVVAGAILAASLAGGAAHGATFSYGYALNSLSGFNEGVAGTSPVSGGDSVTISDTTRIFTTTASGSANYGVVSALASVSADFVFPGFFTARPEGLASVSGAVTICRPGSTALSCLAPSVPISIPVANILMDSIIVNAPGASGKPGLAQATGKVSINGSVVAQATHVSTSSTRIAPAGPLGLTAGTFGLGMSIETIASCSETLCLTSADASNSLKFVEGDDAFLGLPAGYTVYAPDFNIFDNRWIDPRKSAVPPRSDPDPGVIPLPAAGWLLLGGLGGLAALRRWG